MTSRVESPEKNAFNEISQNLLSLGNNNTGTIKFFDN